jgi:hypothetical protein
MGVGCGSEGSEGTMDRNRNRLPGVALCCVAAGLLMVSCKAINREASPVELVVTNTQTISQIDLAGGTGCDQALGTISLQARLKPGAQSSDFNDVKIDRYRVSYVRTDGGKLAPDPFVRTTSNLLTIGGAQANLNDFLVFNAGAFNQAPFVALDPRNGGVDPDTGRTFVLMDVVVEVFGETIAGEAVSGSTRFPLEFCFNCNGCH